MRTIDGALTTKANKISGNASHYIPPSSTEVQEVLVTASPTLGEPADCCRLPEVLLTERYSSHPLCRQEDGGAEWSTELLVEEQEHHLATEEQQLAEQDHQLLVERPHLTEQEHHLLTDQQQQLTEVDHRLLTEEQQLTEQEHQLLDEQQQQLTEANCRLLADDEQLTENHGFTERHRQLIATMKHVQYSLQNRWIIHEPVNSSKDVSETRNVESAEELVAAPIKLYHHNVSEDTQAEVVSELQTLPPLPPLKRAQDNTWYQAKTLQFHKSTQNSPEEEAPAPAVPAKPSNRRSLPHKKRLSKKLRRPESSLQEQALFICQLCGEFYGDDQIHFYHHLKEHYEPHNGTIIIENTIEALQHEHDSISMGKMDEQLLPEALVELSLEAEPSDKLAYVDKTLFTEPQKTHVYNTVDKPLYSCTHCPKTFRRQKQYEVHYRDVHAKVNEIPLISEFSDPEDLMEGIHVMVDATEEYLQGELQGETLLLPPEQYILPHLTVEGGHVHQQHLSKQWYLKTSIDDVHSKTNRIDVDAEPEESEELLEYTTEQPELVCPLCGGILPDRKEYSVHMQHCHMQLKNEVLQHMIDADVEVADDDIGDDNPGDEMDEGSLQDENDEQEESSEKTSEKSSLKKDSKNILTCSDCGRQFKHRNSMIYHMLSHDGTRPYPCQICKKSFFSAGALKVHSRLHSGDKPYKCEDCGRLFRQWGDLKYHFISIHSNQKQHQCEYCGKDFARKYSLIVHRRIHTGEKNYHCEYCNKTFRASSYLQNHRRIHTGEKPHPCAVCGKRFRMKGDMKRHLGTHTKDKHVNVFKDKEKPSDSEEKPTTPTPAKRKAKNRSQTPLPVAPKEEMKTEHPDDGHKDGGGDKSQSGSEPDTFPADPCMCGLCSLPRDCCERFQ